MQDALGELSVQSIWAAPHLLGLQYTHPKRDPERHTIVGSPDQSQKPGILGFTERVDNRKLFMCKTLGQARDESCRLGHK